MYRIFRDFRLAMQDLILMVVLSPKYCVRKALTGPTLCLFTETGIKQIRKYCKCIMLYALTLSQNMAEPLTPGSMFCPQNTTVTQLVIFPAFYGTEIFMVIFKTVRNLSLF
jgi:hypothetical protein